MFVVMWIDEVTEFKISLQFGMIQISARNATLT